MSATLQVGDKHLMFEQPTVKLVEGDEVSVSLVFARSGSGTVDVRSPPPAPRTAWGT